MVEIIIDFFKDYGYLGMGVLAFLSGTVVPITSEVLLVFFLKLGLNAFGITLVATLGNTLLKKSFVIKVLADKSRETLEKVASSLKLPTTVDDSISLPSKKTADGKEVTIVWSSSHPEIMDSTGNAITISDVQVVEAKADGATSDVYNLYMLEVEYQNVDANQNIENDAYLNLKVDFSIESIKYSS